MTKLVIGTSIFLLVTLSWSMRGVPQEVPPPRGELRIVDKRPNNWGAIVHIVFEHLVEVDKHGALVPSLATGWRWLDDRTLELTLRNMVMFPCH